MLKPYFENFDKDAVQVSFLRKITDSGVGSADSKSEKRNIRLTNYISLTAAAAPLLIFLTKALSVGQGFQDAIILIAGSFLLLMPIILNRFGFINTSRIILCWIPFAFLFFGTIIGFRQTTDIKSSDYLTVRFFFIAFSCFPFLVFNLRSTRLFIAGLSSPVLSILLFDPILYFFDAGFSQLGFIEETYSFNTVRVFIAFLIVGFSCFFLKKLVERAEEINENLVTELADKNIEIQLHAEKELDQLNKQLYSNIQQLSERELWFRTLFNSAHDAIFMMDGDKFIDCNEATLQIFNCTREQIIGQTPLKFSPEFQADGSTSYKVALRKINSAIKGVPQTFEWTHIRSDGTPFDAEVSLNRVQLDSEVFLQAIVRDITARKQAEDVIRKKNEELTKINAELDRFVYSASHDLRAPIASLLGLIQVARLETSMEGMDQLLKLQEKSLMRLDHFIRDIVDYSRNTRLQVEAIPIDFNLLMKNTFEQLHFMEHVEHIRKVVTVSQSCEFNSDPKRLEVILNNLISNAIKYSDTRKADPYLEIDVMVKPEMAEIIIRDNGEGIRPESLPKIFNMFYRASERSSGSGIGLYIVHEAVQKLGGQINVQSEFGVHTEFKLTIPGLVVNQQKISFNYSVVAEE